MTKIIKSLNDEERMALFVVLEPQDDPSNVTDLHGDYYTEEDVWEACTSFNVHCRKANLMHLVETEDMEFIQSYTSPVDFTLETLDGTTEIKKGTWLAWVHFPETELGDLIWKGVKAGDFNGLSVQCSASCTPMENI